MRRLATGGDRHEAPADFIFGRETKGFEDALDLLAHLRHVLLKRQRNHCDTPCAQCRAMVDLMTPTAKRARAV